MSTNNWESAQKTALFSHGSDTGGATVMTSWLSRGFWNLNQSSSGHAINRVSAPSSTNPAENVCAPYYMKTFLRDVQTGVEAASGTQQSAVRKIVRDGQILIVKGNKTFNLFGQEQ